jgi:hypothetical protein
MGTHSARQVGLYHRLRLKFLVYWVQRTMHSHSWTTFRSFSRRHNTTRRFLYSSGIKPTTKRPVGLMRFFLFCIPWGVPQTSRMVAFRMKDVVLSSSSLLPQSCFARVAPWGQYCVRASWKRGQDCRTCSGVSGPVLLEQSGTCDRVGRYMWTRSWQC